jgi:hypothetical protein
MTLFIPTTYGRIYKLTGCASTLRPCVTKKAAQEAAFEVVPAFAGPSRDKSVIEERTHPRIKSEG